MKITTKGILAALKKLDYPVFTGDYNLTLVGIRSKDMDANSFNDSLVVLYEVAEKMQMHVFPVTTDPGVYYRKNLLNVDGTAVLVPGHYRGCWTIGAHQGKYKALVQCAPMRVYRDGNKDAKIDIDENTIQTGIYGINLHRSNQSRYSLQVDRWSAGCQVFSDPINFASVMELAEKSAKTYGRKFSYSLLTEDQL